MTNTMLYLTVLFVTAKHTDFWMQINSIFFGHQERQLRYLRKQFLEQYMQFPAFPSRKIHM